MAHGVESSKASWGYKPNNVGHLQIDNSNAVEKKKPLREALAANSIHVAAQHAAYAQ